MRVSFVVRPGRLGVEPVVVESPETPETRETATPQGPVPAVDESPLLISTRQSGKYNHAPDTVAPARSAPIPETRSQVTPSRHLDETQPLPFKSRISATAHNREHNNPTATTKAGTRTLRQVATLRSTRGQEAPDVDAQ